MGVRIMYADTVNHRSEHNHYRQHSHRRAISMRVKGTPGNAMCIEFGGLISGLAESVVLVGFDQ